MGGGESHSDGAGSSHGWSTAATQLRLQLLFDQLSPAFRQEEVNVHRLSGRTPLGEPIAVCLPVYFYR